MLISGIQKCTTIDYPEHLSCIVFTPGCNMRCKFCHNPEFVLPERIKKIKDSFIPEDIFFKFLESRKNLLEAVVITGGEPTLMVDLVEFIRKIKDLGFKVKLDSNGQRPEVLKKLLDNNLVDYIAMDVKASLENYNTLTGKFVRTDKIKESINLLKNQNSKHKIIYEFRTTMIKDIHDKQEMLKIGELIKGADQLNLQTFRSGNTLDPSFKKYDGYNINEMNDFAEILKSFANKVSVRN